MSQSKITTFANETLDKIFAYLANKNAWLALIKGKVATTNSSQDILLTYYKYVAPLLCFANAVPRHFIIRANSLIDTP